MRLLIDTQLLIWTGSGRLSRAAAALIGDEANTPMFSAVSVVEVAIKFAQRRPDFLISPDEFRQRLLDNAFIELPLTSEHARRVIDLPLIHKDPFDRMLAAQAISERATLLTTDVTLGRYGPRVTVV